MGSSTTLGQHATGCQLFKRAAVHALTGLVVGAICVLVMVGLQKTFPELADFDHDFGLRLTTWSNEAQSPWRPLQKTPAYVFVDVDAAVDREDKLASWAGCNALAARFPDRYFVTRGSAVGGLDSPPVTSRTRLDCSDSRILNRYLLAESVREIRERAARLVVLDVEVEAVSDFLPRPEVDALLRELSRSDAVPLLFALPATYLTVGAGSGRMFITSGPRFDLPGGASAAGAPAFPSPGQPIRRYPRLVADSAIGGNMRPHGNLRPTLPCLAAAVIDRPGASPAFGAGDICLEPKGDEAPRIHFSMPPLQSHVDAAETSVHYGADVLYRQSHERCLLAKLWSTDTQCGRADFFKGKVVVIGASSRIRGDRHPTPLGDMAGAEVIMNAIESFRQEIGGTGTRNANALVWKASALLAGAFVWLCYFLFTGYLDGKWAGQRAAAKEGTESAARKRLRLLVLGLIRFTYRSALFLSTVCVVVAVTILMGVPSFSVILGLLVVGLELYVHLLEVVVLEPLRLSLHRLFGLEVGGRH